MVNLTSLQALADRLFSDDIRINLHRCGWGDSLTGNQKIIFALQLALFKAKKGLGYKIEFTDRPLFEGKTAVYNPFVFNVIASTMTSSGTCGDTWKHIKFNFTAQSYSVRSIYEGAYKELTKGK